MPDEPNNPGILDIEDAESLLDAEGGDPSPPQPSPQEEAVRLFNQRLDMESLPEELRGRSVGELIQRQVAMEQALKMSERAREDLSQAMRSGSGRQQQQQEFTPPPSMSKEEFSELMQNDPMAAIDMMIQQRGGDFVRHVEQRIAPLGNAAAMSAERSARDKYKLEFELFGDQIQSLINSTDRSVFSNQQAWDDMIAYVRGKPDNITKYIGAVTKTEGTAAREREAANAGVNLTSQSRSGNVGGGSGWDGADDLTREIGQTLGFNSYAEYKKWQA